MKKLSYPINVQRVRLARTWTPLLLKRFKVTCCDALKMIRDIFFSSDAGLEVSILFIMFFSSTLSLNSEYYFNLYHKIIVIKIEVI
jgi:hypothetical protein